ncbi:phosphohistidine phosphatase SixA [Rosenbergiella australiborealis]|uniref:Phosphohistidine phosphatase SixA n=1 Tax=Rosenbergiella australiborealis TaxID=1544696 RepID=A0ABS5T2X3_9GAMM|nr:phosphohistidine phosphatase SixA [Rosenbergiella australiborealis]MBT0726712.1 phosphohistidine phosphatase SixA [Rosenbergiella australiborealis]
MHVYIMRHGDAALDAASDAQRPLTRYGVEETQQMSRWLVEQQPAFDVTLVSPFLRAQQTFMHFSENVPQSGKVETLELLTPAGDAKEVSDYLHALAREGVDTVMVISHLPLVGYLVTALCPEQCPPMFATAGIAHIDYDVTTSRGTLCWQESPSRLAAAM